MPFCSEWTPFHARNFHLLSPICLNIANFPSVTQHFPRQCHKYMKHGMLTSFSVDQQYKTPFNQTAGTILIIRLISSTIVQKTNECIKYYTYVISWRFFIFEDEIFIAKTNYIDSYSISNNISKMQAHCCLRVPIECCMCWNIHELKYFPAHMSLYKSAETL